MKNTGMRLGFVVVVFWSVLALGQRVPPETQTASSRSSDRALEQAHKELDQSETEMQVKRQDLWDLQSKIREASGLIVVTPDALRQLAERLQDLQESMDVEEAGAVGRQEAIAAAIDKTSKQLSERASSDEVANELNKVVEARQKQLQRVQQLRQQAAVANSEVDAAEAALATARAELAASRQRAIGAGGDALDALNRELISLTIARKERAAKMQFIRDRLKRLEPALSLASEWEQRVHNLAASQCWLDSAVERLRAIESSRSN